VKKRSDAALPLPDLLLGIFVDYARLKLKAETEPGSKKRASGAQADLRFEGVRDRVRAIYDLDGGRVSSRTRPFLPW
jgi:hypothetical protein